MKLKKILFGLFIIHIALIIGSCISASKQKYFNDYDQLKIAVNNPKEQPLIMPFDKIDVQVFSIDENTTKIFSNYNNPGDDKTDLVVDKDGNIRFPLVGKIQIGGLTPDEASLKIEEELNSYVADINITIRFAENMVTVMGEVNNQGTFTFNQDKLNIYQAITLGGGISQYGNRKKVVLIRQNGNDIMYFKLNLSDSKITERSYYYIQPNDVIIVEPLRAASWFKFNSSSFASILTTLTSMLMLFMYINYR